MGALVTLELPDDSPVLSLPWIITIGPLNDDEEWDPVVCGPYERPHALALAESVVADEELMAVVEPLQPHVTVAQIRDDVAAARQAAEKDAEAAGLVDADDAVEAAFGADAGGHAEAEYAEPSPPPSADEVRDGFARIATRLIGGRAPAV